MGERYSRVFTYKENTYAEGSPVIISAGALLNDTVTNNIIAQLKFKNICDKNIKSLTIEVIPLDTANRPLGDAVKKQYLDLNAKYSDEFGAKQPILLPDNTTRSFKARVVEAVFTDNTIWDGADSMWEQLPIFEHDIIKNNDTELKKQFSLKYGITYNNDFKEHKDLWYCPCGAITKGLSCCWCQTDRRVIVSIDYSLLKKDCDTRIAVENAERARIAEEQRIAAQKAAEERQKREEAKKLEKEATAKKIKKIAIIATPIICMLIVLAIILVTVVIPTVKKNNFIKQYGQEVYDRFGMFEEGEYITFGAYEQDNNLSNGKEPIEWLVLDLQKDKALLISKHSLDTIQYNTELVDTTWENCSLRTWLNSSFVNTAFTDSEKSEIESTFVSADTNPLYPTVSGNSTNDQLFLLSIEEANLYFEYNSDRCCSPTEYAAHKGTDGSWWLRTPGYHTNHATTVYSNGAVVYTGYMVTLTSNAVRPAMWIDLNK